MVQELLVEVQGVMQLPTHSEGEEATLESCSGVFWRSLRSCTCRSKSGENREKPSLHLRGSLGSEAAWRRMGEVAGRTEREGLLPFISSPTPSYSPLPQPFSPCLTLSVLPIKEMSLTLSLRDRPSRGTDDTELTREIS